MELLRAPGDHHGSDDVLHLLRLLLARLLAQTLKDMELVDEVDKLWKGDFLVLIDLSPPFLLDLLQCRDHRALLVSDDGLREGSGGRVKEFEEKDEVIVGLLEDEDHSTDDWPLVLDKA